MQPPLTKQSVLAAMKEFDFTLRNTEEWRNWENNKAHRYAIENEGKLYPVRRIASIASGFPLIEFRSGQKQGHVNNLVENLGFRVITLRGSNPDWTRDELILALNVYLNHRPNPLNKASKEIVELSKTLQKLGRRLFPPADRADSFRNAKGVYMKLMNFRRLDPDCTSAGKKCLTQAAKGEEEVWAEFANDPARCQATAKTIIGTLDDPEAGGPETEIPSVRLRLPDGCAAPDHG